MDSCAWANPTISSPFCRPESFAAIRGLPSWPEVLRRVGACVGRGLAARLARVKASYLVGNLLDRMQVGLMASRHFPLFRMFLGHRSWPYDVSRLAGTRDLRVVFDVGANVGQTTRLLGRFFPGATLHSFEPVSSTFRQLQSNCGRMRGVHLHLLALGREPGRLTLRLQSNSELNSLKFSVSEPGEAATTESVTVTTAAAFCAEQGIESIDLLKIDAQGADLDVLRGAEPLLRASRVPFVLAEVSFAPDDVTNQPFEPLHHYLGDQGFRLSGFYELFNYGQRHSLLGFCNALYVHPGALARRFPD